MPEPLLAFRPAICAAPAAVANHSAGRAAKVGRPAGDLGDPARLTERVSVARCAGRLWPLQDAGQPVRALGAQGGLGAGVYGTGGGRGPAGRPAARLHAGLGAAVSGGRKRGALHQAIGRSRGGPHDQSPRGGRRGRPAPAGCSSAPGIKAMCPSRRALGAALTPPRGLADTAYDSDAFRAWLGRRGWPAHQPQTPRPVSASIPSIRWPSRSAM